MTVLKMLRAFTEEQEVYLAKDPLNGYTVYDHNVDVTEHTLNQVALVLSRQFTGLPVDFNEKEQYLTINGITYTYNPERYFGYDVTLVINAIDIKDTETLLKRVIATSVLFTHALILANHGE